MNTQNINERAKENLKEWLEITEKVEKAAIQTGITLEQGMRFLKYLEEENEV
jgi:hypothetical protein